MLLCYLMNCDHLYLCSCLNFVNKELVVIAVTFVTVLFGVLFSDSFILITLINGFLTVLFLVFNITKISLFVLLLSCQHFICHYDHLAVGLLVCNSLWGPVRDVNIKVCP